MKEKKDLEEEKEIYEGIIASNKIELNDVNELLKGFNENSTNKILYSTLITLMNDIKGFENSHKLDIRIINKSDNKLYISFNYKYTVEYVKGDSKIKHKAIIKRGLRKAEYEFDSVSLYDVEEEKDYCEWFKDTILKPKLYEFLKGSLGTDFLTIEKLKKKQKEKRKRVYLV